MDIRELINAVPQEESKEYKAGWADCVCYMLDEYHITTRKNEPIQIGFEVTLNEDELIEKIMEKIDAGKS